MVVSKILTDQEVKDLQGTWIEESHIKHPVLNESTDVYYIDESGNEKLLLKYRKNQISKWSCSTPTVPKVKCVEMVSDVLSHLLWNKE